MCGRLGFPSGELGPAVISRIGFKNLGDYYEATHARSHSLLFDAPRHSAALLRSARPSLHRNAGASRVQRRGDRKRTHNLTGLTFSDVFITAPVINAGL